MQKYQSAGFIDYLNDFEKNTVISCHWWNNAFFSKHYHNYYEVFVVTSGKTKHILNDKTTVIHSRQMYIIRPSDIHQAIQIDNEKYQHFNIAATDKVFKNTCDFLSLGLYEKINNAKEISFMLSNQEYNYFINLANKIHTLDVNLREKKEIKMLYEKQLLAFSLSLYYEKSQAQESYPEWFGDLLQKINSPKYIDCKITDIYEMSNYSAPSLVKYFKLYTSGTITNYLQKTKINYACNLLETTNFTTLEISSKLGYDSLSHFNTLFKKITGYTPVEYKKNFKHKK